MQEEVLRVRYIEKFVQKSVMVIVITFLALIALWIDESDKVRQYNETWITVRVESKQQLALLSAEAAAFAGQYAVELLDVARRSVTPLPYILPHQTVLCTIANTEQVKTTNPVAIQQPPYSDLFVVR